MGVILKIIICIEGTIQFISDSIDDESIRFVTKLRINLKFNIVLLLSRVVRLSKFKIFV